MTRNTVQSFWSKVSGQSDPLTCWIWSGVVGTGYGLIKWNGKNRSAHRLAWSLTFGDIPEHLCVCHNCDTPLCCNPNHLFLGTVQDNNADMVKKKRHARGVTHGRAKITQADADHIRSLSSTISQSDIARRFSMSRAQIQNIIFKRHWVAAGT